MFERSFAGQRVEIPRIARKSDRGRISSNTMCSFLFSSDVVLLYVRCRKVRQAFFVVSTCLRFSQAFFMDRSRTPTVHGSVHDCMKKNLLKEKNRLTVAYVYRIRRSSFERR